MQDKSQNSSSLKIPALTFLRTALESTSPGVWQQHLPVLAPAVFATVGERYYKVTSQGLRVAEQLIYVIRPQTQAQMPADAVVGSLLRSTPSRHTGEVFEYEVLLCVEHSVSLYRGLQTAFWFYPLLHLCSLSWKWYFGSHALKQACVPDVKPSDTACICC